MAINLLLIGIIIPILSYIFQIYPRFFNRYFGVDVWTRLTETDLIRKNNHRIPQQPIKGSFMVPGNFDYPPVFPWLLSFIPKKTLLEIQGFIAPIFDVVQNFIVFIITYQITSNILIALLAQIIYASIPLLNIENSYLTPRSLGYLNFTLAFYPLLLWTTVPNYLYLFISFIFTVAIFFTHRFATQSMLFACIFFTIYDQSLFYLSFFGVALVTAIVISKGYYLNVLKGHLFNIYFWTHNYHFRFAHQVRGLTINSKSDFVGKIYGLMRIFTPISLLPTNIWLVIPLFIAINYFIGIDISFIKIYFNPEIYQKLTVLVAFFYFFSVAVLSIKILIPIGEGQRYLEMITAPTAIISALTIYGLLQTPWRNLTIASLIFLLISNLAVTLILQWKGIIKDKNRSLTEDLNQVFSFLDSRRPQAKVLCIPHQITTLILYNSKAKVFVNAETKGLMHLTDVFPILKLPVKEIAKKHGLNTLVLKKSYASMKELKLHKKDLLLETETTQVFRI